VSAAEGPGPAARAALRLGVLGGSFDPPHLGHLHAARRARAAFQLDHVLFVPAARPPHKPERILAEAPVRLEMLALLLADCPWASAWDVELARAGPSYTLETLRALRAAAHPEARLYLVLGTDNLPGFPRWKGIEEIVALAQPIVVARAGAGPDEVALAGLSAHARTRIALGRLGGPVLEASSTELRARLARGEDVAGWLPPALADLVTARRIYRAS